MPISYKTFYVQSVVVNGTVFIGGGGGAGGDDDCTIMAYDTIKWATLPPYQASHFAMTAVDNLLLLVGGKGSDDTCSKTLGVWSTDGKKWTHPYPDMTTPRYKCSAVSYKHWVVVAGGRGDGGLLSSVEVMNTDTEQWYAGPPTPIAWGEIKTAVVDDTCYYCMGGSIRDPGYTNRVYSVSLPTLISRLNRDSSANDTQMWKKISELPVWDAAPVSISGSLVAVGGVDRNRKAVSTLHLYQPDARQWVKVADMPIARYGCTCLMISDNELLVAGGIQEKQVDIAKIR